MARVLRKRQKDIDEDKSYQTGTSWKDVEFLNSCKLDPFVTASKYQKSECYIEYFNR